jgi:hypothetical protein
MKFNLQRHLRGALIAISASALLSATPCAMAQAVFGQILGTVTDPTGAAIPGATITVTDVAKGTSVTLTSNGTGEFTVEHLIPDTYNVKISAQGFKAYEQSGLQVFADTAPKVAAVLTIGASGETVEVNANDIPQLKTDKADVSTIFNAQEVEELPIPDHNFTNLQLLLPGAQQLGWSHATDENPQGSKQIQVDGQAFGGVAYELDGTDNQDPILGIIVINPNSDSLSEAKIATQNFDAEFGKAVASFITVQTKSGTNEFHGTAFDNRESNANLAREPFSQSNSGPNPQLTATNPFPSGLKNQFGGSIGGPILKDKLFFFGDYQGVRQKVGISDIQTVPSSLLVATCLGQKVGASGIPGCDFSEYIAYGVANPAKAANGNTYNPYQIYQPNGTPYPGGVIPAAQVSGFAKNLFAKLQPFAPNAPGLNGAFLSNNYAKSGSGLFNSNQWDVRGDYTVNEKIHAFGRFSRFTDTETGNTIFGNAGGVGFGLQGYGGSSTGANDSLALGTDIAINSKLVTDVRLGYYRYNIITAKYDQGNANLPIQGENISGTGGNSGLTVAQDFGAPDINISDLNVTSPTNGPNNGTGTGAQYGAGLNVDRCNCPLKEKEDQFQIVNNWTRTLGNHAIKFGVDLRYARNLRVPSDNDRTGINNFSTGPTSYSGIDPTLNQTGGLGFATFALGEVTAYNRYASLSTNAKEFQQRFFFYGQDTWRPTSKLTLNYGLRLEEYSPERVNGKGNGALLNLDTGYINVAGYGNVPLNMGVSRTKFPFNPRAGVAYQLNPKTVLRAGYGRSFDLGVFGSEFGHVVTQNLPVLVNQSISSTGGTTSYAFNVDNPATGPNPLSNYVPVAPNANGQIVNPGASVNTKARPFQMRLPTLDAWNATIQRSITPTISVTAAYVGNKGTHTLSAGDGNNTNPNESAIVLPAQYSVTGNALHYDPAGASTAAAITSSGAVSNQTLLQRYYGGSLPACGGPCGWTQGISYYGNNQDTHYNALQISAAKAYSKGNSVNVNYAYQRASNFNSGYATWNKQVTEGNDDSIRRNQITVYGLYKFPFGRGQQFLSNVNPVVNYIIGGFEITPVLVYSSGLPYTLSYDSCSASIPGSAPCYVNGSSSSLKHGFTGFAGGTGSQQARWFTPPGLTGAFSAPGLDQIGNGGRNNAFGPHFFNGDLSLLKNFTIREKYTAQFRMDAFNAFNHVNLGNPGGSVESGGTIGGGTYPNNSVNPRQLQFTARVQF